MRARPYLFLLLTGVYLWFISCMNEPDTLGSEDYSKYYPLNIGDSLVYHIIPSVAPDTVHVLKVIDTTVIDGNTCFVIRSKYPGRASFDTVYLRFSSGKGFSFYYDTALCIIDFNSDLGNGDTSQHNESTELVNMRYFTYEVPAGSFDSCISTMSYGMVAPRESIYAPNVGEIHSKSNGSVAILIRAYVNSIVYP